MLQLAEKVGLWVAVAALVVRALCPGGARAATDVVPSMSISAEANDNPRLRPSGDSAFPPSGAGRMLFEAGARIQYYTPRSEISLEPALRSDAYTDSADDDLQSTDLYLRSVGATRWQRARAGFAVDLAREKIRGTDFLLDVPGGGEIVDVDSVSLGLNETRTRAILSPYVEIDFGQRSGVRLDLRVMDVSYADQSPASLRTDFSDLETGAAYVRQLTARTRLSTRVFGSSYETSGSRNITDTSGLELLMESELSNVWSLAATLGAERSEYRFFDENAVRFAGTDDDVVLGLALTKTAETGRYRFGLSRRARPDSFGSLVTRNELFVETAHELSERLHLDVSGRLVDSDALGVIPRSREYGRLQASFRWSISEFWSVLAGYEYAQWRNLSTPTRASSNSVVVGFGYRGRSSRSAQE